MKPFYPCDPIADDHLLDLRLTVGDVRILIATLDRYSSVFRSLSDRGQRQMADAEQYLEDRDAGDHCFVTMGKPFNEQYPNGFPLAALVNDAAKIEHTTMGITDHGRQVASLSRRKPGDDIYGDPHERGWYVYAVENDGAGGGEFALAKRPYGRIEGVGDGQYEVKNPGMPTVYRPDMGTAALTCYLRGKQAAERRAAKKAAKPKAAKPKAAKPKPVKGGT